MAMFVDETIIHVKGGTGGDGCKSYSRAKYRPFGPPNGGNGGRGGNISIVGTANVHTLRDASFQGNYFGGRGTHGKGCSTDGRSGEDVLIPVPLGTMVYDQADGRLIVDCVKEGEEIVVARGGKGGRGNYALKTRENPFPQEKEAGPPGEVRRLRMELKVLADVGLVGRPNAGKSTLLSKVSRAHPKIADYPFTTTSPNLGIVTPAGGYGSFVMADIPGLIEGSHTGKGLGIRFLRHIERTRVLAVMVESLSEDPKADAKVLVDELSHYSKELAKKPRCFIYTKADLLPKGKRPKLPRGWLVMSAVTGEGVDAVVRRLDAMLVEARKKGSEKSSEA